MITETTAGTGIPLEDVISIVLGTGIIVGGLTMDQTNLTSPTRRTEAMGVTTPAATAIMELAIMLMDSPVTLTVRQGASQVKTTSRPSSLPLLRLVHRTVPLIPRSPSLRHRLLPCWCRTPCLLSSLSKFTTYLKEVIYCFLSC